MCYFESGSQPGGGRGGSWYTEAAPRLLPVEVGTFPAANTAGNISRGSTTPAWGGSGVRLGANMLFLSNTFAQFVDVYSQI